MKRTRAVEIILGIVIFLFSHLQFNYVFGVPIYRLGSTWIWDLLWDCPFMFGVIITMSLLFFLIGSFIGLIVIFVEGKNND